jgi:hypothetical protein
MDYQQSGRLCGHKEWSVLAGSFFKARKGAHTTIDGLKGSKTVTRNFRFKSGR